ncbi:MAG TPA: DUF721 domain-containing protein [Candidatus Cloacimonadota bacterium]|nr:DUF721 domain-containing protein [Candidatus Cloacimonadota bacterium]
MNHPGRMALNSISTIGHRLALNLAGEKYRPFIKLYLGWRAVVGDLLAQRSHPYRYKDGILYVAVQNNSWLQELVLRKQEIIAKCAQECGETPKDMMFFIRA